MKLFKLLLSILLSFTLVACTGTGDKDKEPSGPVELIIWNTYSEHHAEAYNKIVEDFNASQSEVKVIVQPQAYQDYEAKILQAVRNGVGPDVVSAYPTAVSAYIDEGLLVDFAPFINGSDGIADFKDNLIGKLYGEITQWGEESIYMIPVVQTSEVLFYNATWYEELNLTVPTTWEELEANSRVILANKGVPGFGTDSEIDTFQDLIVQAGSGYINPTTKTVEFDNEIALAQLTWFSELVSEGVFRLVGEDFYFSNPFGSQAVGSYLGSSAGVQYALGAAGDKFTVGVAPIPQMGLGNDYIPSWGGGYISFKTTDEKAEAAFKFLKYLSSTEVSASWATTLGGLPAYQTAVETELYQAYLDSNPAAKALYQQVDSFGWLNSIAGSAPVRGFIGKMVQEASTGLKTPAQALQDCVTASNNELQAH
ncbi:MAG: extracellular solute-binding protein [Erysipelotrichaceae bacterium]|nr:extracellular solute-binding protein [Erysipelotrichaceae bacterium]